VAIAPRFVPVGIIYFHNHNKENFMKEKDTDTDTNSDSDSVSDSDSDSDDNVKKVNNAKIYTNCFTSAAMAINTLHGHGRLLDCPTVADELINSAKKITSGNISEIEQMLMTQAKALEYLFYDAMTKLSELDMINQIETFINIALRSQSQCRKTLATLAEIKHPKRTTFIDNQNNAIQVNNELKSKKHKKVANKVVSEVKLEKMDSGRATQTITVNAATETVDVFDRTKNTAR
jgi:hypothetical protein